MATLLLVFGTGLLAGRSLGRRQVRRRYSSAEALGHKEEPGESSDGATESGRLEGDAESAVAATPKPVLGAKPSAGEAAAAAAAAAGEGAGAGLLTPSPAPPSRWRRALRLAPRVSGSGAAAPSPPPQAAAGNPLRPLGDAAASAEAVSANATAAAAAPAAAATPAMHGRRPSVPEPQTPTAAATPAATTAAAPPPPPPQSDLEHPTHVWYVSEKDLDFFRARAELDQPFSAAAGGWAHVMEREVVGSYRYTSYRRSRPNGIGEYRSVTVVPDVSPLEYLDFSLDDNSRCQWEGFMVSAEVLEAGEQRQRQQVVRWIRTFPFGFITDRQYVIARQLYSVTPDGAVHKGLPYGVGGPGSGPGPQHTPVADFYVITKSIDHPGAHDGAHGKVVQIQDYHSMWRCRTVPCPWGGPRPAVEVVLLHSEDMRIPERLARMAINMGMSKFVHTMCAAVPGFVQERRRRVGPTQTDPLSYGHHHHVYGKAAKGHVPPEELAAAAAAAEKEASHARVMAAAAEALAAPATPSPAAAPPPSAAAPSPLTPTPGGGREVAAPLASEPASARALWHPSMPSAAAAATPPPPALPGRHRHHERPHHRHGAFHTAVSRFSLAEVALSNGHEDGHEGGGSEHGAGEREGAAEPGASADVVGGAGAGGGGEAAGAGWWAGDPWARIGRAMSATGLWQRQDLPQVSSAWGASPQGAGRRGPRPRELSLNLLLRRAAIAGLAVAVLRRVLTGGRGGGGKGKDKGRGTGRRGVRIGTQGTRSMDEGTEDGGGEETESELAREGRRGGVQGRGRGEREGVRLMRVPELLGEVVE
ncbi:hypothetical protein HYH03_007916 [Edaphochlamys debaryana]|uniref:START domain-containing protein n=1 Tax=Edaphochlamys debaryana TaxID=47281 RepID=A0A836C016_9CHLO|nr:hypothetical protein HYH03_007916 [Edaphochlamys debaryana]|eukprot:KAG2493989.1 hypothetical protein HYH03_007916 [Edaphochlamys debaryana]